MLTLPALGIIWSMFELPTLCEAQTLKIDVVLSII